MSRAGALVLALAAAGMVATAALAAQPAWRIADRHRALEIGLSRADAGRAWSDAGEKPSPFAIDLGAVAGASLTEACAGPVPATKATVDLEVTAASESLLAHPGGTLASITMLFKTSTVARMQLPGAAQIAAITPCFASELQKGLGAVAKVSFTKTARRRITTGSPASFAVRMTGTLRAGGAAAEPLYVDLVVQQGGRGLVETAYFGVGAPPSTPLEVRLAHVSAKRLDRYAA